MLFKIEWFFSSIIQADLYFGLVKQDSAHRNTRFWSVFCHFFSSFVVGCFNYGNRDAINAHTQHQKPNEQRYFHASKLARNHFVCLAHKFFIQHSNEYEFLNDVKFWTCLFLIVSGCYFPCTKLEYTIGFADLCTAKR